MNGYDARTVFQPMEEVRCESCSTDSLDGCGDVRWIPANNARQLVRTHSIQVPERHDGFRRGDATALFEVNEVAQGLFRRSELRILISAR